MRKLKEFCRRNDASMTSQVMIYSGKFYFKWMFHKLHLQMSDYVQHLGCSSVHAASGGCAQMPDTYINAPIIFNSSSSGTSLYDSTCSPGANNLA